MKNEIKKPDIILIYKEKWNTGIENKDKSCNFLWQF